MSSAYCERCGPGLFDEPANAATNVAFFLAAWAAWRLGSRLRVLSAGPWVLIGLTMCVGVGSTLWHTFATPWAGVLDRVPILVFQLCFLGLYARRVSGLHLGAVALLVALYLAAAVWGSQYREWLNESVMYAPALTLAVLVGLYHRYSGQCEPYLLLAGAGVFGTALFFRTIDQLVCPWFPLGTHFLWHLLVGLVTYTAMRALIVTSARPRDRNSSNND